MSIKPKRLAKIGLRKLPAKYQNLVLPFLLSVVMTCIVSGISLLRNFGFTSNFLSLWLSAWSVSWLIAFPVLLLILPQVKRLSLLIVESGPG